MSYKRESPSKLNEFSSSSKNQSDIFFPKEEPNLKYANILSSNSNSVSSEYNQSPSLKSESEKNDFHGTSNFNEKERIRSRETSPKHDFVIRNGCCKDCMKAFNKNGRSCLCQVPKSERRFHLPEKGCNFCGCTGCNPVDVKRAQRNELKRKYLEDKNFAYKNERLLDSEDEELRIHDK